MGFEFLTSKNFKIFFGKEDRYCILQLCKSTKSIFLNFNFLLFFLFFSLLESRKGQRTTVQDIEDVLDGNLCRCTGYRPIFDAFKSLANVDNPIPDIEDMRKCPINKNGSRGIGKIKSSIDGVDWYIPTTVNDLMTVLAQLAPETTYRYSLIKR